MRTLRDVPDLLSSYDDARKSGDAPVIPPRRDPVSMAELIKNSSRPASNSSRKSTNSQKENEGGSNVSEILPGLLWATAATITVCAIIYFVCSSSQDNAASVDALEGDTTTDTAAPVKDPPLPAVPPAPEPKPAHHSDPLFSPL